MISTLKNTMWIIGGLFALYVGYNLVGFATWISTLPFSIGLKLFGLGTIALTGYAVCRFIKNKIVSILS